MFPFATPSKHGDFKTNNKGYAFYQNLLYSVQSRKYLSRSEKKQMYDQNLSKISIIYHQMQFTSCNHF